LRGENAGLGAEKEKLEAENKLLQAQLAQHASVEGTLAHFSSSMGTDLSRYELDEPIQYKKNDANNSAVEAITTLSREPWTLRRIIGQMGLGSRNAPIVGSAEEVADELIAWVEETGVEASIRAWFAAPEAVRACSVAGHSSRGGAQAWHYSHPTVGSGVDPNELLHRLVASRVDNAV
jgi:alkanesulfonate monooxygenase SsuD/methylene tetrahydromethanopterin reductase-like flavin-dependent oxidoreductase (luciferase family)